MEPLKCISVRAVKPFGNLGCPTLSGGRRYRELPRSAGMVTRQGESRVQRRTERRQGGCLSQKLPYESLLDSRRIGTVAYLFFDHVDSNVQAWVSLEGWRRLRSGHCVFKALLRRTKTHAIAYLSDLHFHDANIYLKRLATGVGHDELRPSRSSRRREHILMNPQAHVLVTIGGLAG